MKAWNFVFFALVSGCLSDCDEQQAQDAVGHLEACDSQDDCEVGLVCAGDAVCRPVGEAGTYGLGAECPSNQYCQLGLVCDHSGECAQPDGAGTSGLGGTCDTDDDCQFGLTCKEGACYGMQVPLWLGEVCDASDDGDFRVHFEVPRGEPLPDFYRLPFPNDVRVASDGTLDLSDHPTPGPLIPLLGDVAAEILNVLGDDFDGFGTHQAVFLRMSQEMDYSSLELDLPQDGGNVGVVDLTPGADYGLLRPAGYKASNQRGQYICDHWISLYPVEGYFWKAGHTYAAYLTSDVLSQDGDAATQDEDFAALLAPSAPVDTGLAAAWEAYQPLRDWLAYVPLSIHNLAGAAVFTVGDPLRPTDLLRQAINVAPVPAASGLHLCDDEPGPYADGGTNRGCFGADADYHEIQGTLPLAQYQSGLPPFKQLNDGGAIDSSMGVPSVQRTDDVVFSLTVPTGVTMPAEGWPLLIYGHGSNGDYRSALRDDIGRDLATLRLDDGTDVAFAVLSYDQLHHGSRRHEENWDASWLAVDPNAFDGDTLYFNALNPWAARDNALQAAADLWQVVAMARALDWDAEASPTGSAIRFDTPEIHYMGHSQGSVNGVAAVAWEPAIRSAVFSGGGALFIEGLLGKKSPSDVLAQVKVGLADPNVERSHPLLNILQGAAERSDSANHAHLVQDQPLSGYPVRHVLQTYGLYDTYTPESAQYELARRLKLSQVTNGQTALRWVPETQAPVKGNFDSGSTTAVVVLYLNITGGDGHFVLFDLDDARRQYSHFLGTAVRDGVPTVVEP